ncbi:MAG TPA: FAD-dependent oxidoreductase [Firmicutes bacterium]|nr:FAD-dependent oxidoreductase [Bacillota bacterium]
MVDNSVWRKHHKVDLCVVGGGLAGMCAAIAAARHGIKVALMHDRPVLGGNASSEIRMWICGARGPNNRETGIVEEIELENRYRNPSHSYAIWDSILYEKVAFQENLTLILNCSCLDATMEGNRIKAIKGWQLTTYTWHIVEAELFADCSGDSILAPLTGALYRMGREAKGEFNESIQPDVADNKTMGMSCLIQARETSSPQQFIPPFWANKYESEDDLPHRSHDVLKKNTNFWWLELGGEQHSIKDTEEIRDELLKAAFGVWDHIKNRGDHKAQNWMLDWVGFLPGKRESRRYVGDHILTQNDVRAEGRFPDLVAYGGWPMDDHHPGGLRWKGRPTIFHPAPSPFGIPYRCLYSKNIENLYFAGRNISTTHAALSSTRVMATCAILGQAVGTAAAIAVKEGLTPRGVYERKISELQQRLMADDCYLPWQVRAIPEVTKNAALTVTAGGDPEPLRNGIDRPVGDVDNGWSGPLEAHITYTFAGSDPVHLKSARLVFDSDLNREGKNMPSSFPLDAPCKEVPATLIKEFRLEALTPAGDWQEVVHVTNNYQRLVKLPLDVQAKAIRFTPLKTWGSAEAHLFAFEVDR